MSMFGFHMKKETKKRFNKFAQGSISVLLTILLVPIISVAGLFVDVSRYQLAKAELSSAADLTLNTALTNYDTVLKDVYGLFATSQSADDLSDGLKDYFMATLTACGISESEASATSNALLAEALASFSGDTSDLLEMGLLESDDGSGLSVNGVSGTQLAKADILKNQIVEYNKYRTPLNACASIIDSIKALSRLSQQTEVAEAEAKVAEDNGDLAKAAGDFYKACKAYNDALLEYGKRLPVKAAADYGTSSYSGLGNIWIQKYTVKGEEAFKVTDYKTVLLNVIGYLKYKTNADSPSHYLTKATKKNDGTITLEFNNSVSYELYATSDDLKKLQDLSTDDQVKKLKELQKYLLDTNKNLTKYVCKTITKVASLESGNELKSTYYPQAHTFVSYVRAIYKLGNLLGKDKMESEGLYDDYKEILEDAYLLRENIVRIESAFAAWVDSTLLTLKGDAQKDYDAITNLEAKAKTAKEKGDNLEALVKKLAEDNAAFKTKIGSYTSNGGSDNFSQTMAAEQSGYEETVSLDDLNNLRSALTTSYNYLTSAESYLKNTTLGGKTVYSDGFKGEVENIENGYVWVYPDKNSDELLQLYNQDHSPWHEPDKPQKVDMNIDNQNFWKYLEATYANQDAEKNENSDAEKQKKQIADYGKQQAEETESDSGSGSGSISGDDLPSGKKENREGGSGAAGSEGSKVKEDNNDFSSVDTSKNSGFSTMLSNISSSLKTMLNGVKTFMTNARDNLYVTDYAFNMFSWATQAKEAKVKNGGTAVDLKTSSGYAISAQNNVLYGGEIEYLIYGKKSVSSNVSTAKGFIFAIRFAANSIFALSDSTINAQTLPIAAAIQAATLGWVPAQLIQVVLKLSLALAETAVDMNELMNGESVPFLKDSGSWTMSIQGAINYAKKKATATIREGATNVSGAVSKLIDNAGDKIEVTADEYLSDLENAANAQIEEAVSGICTAFSNKIVSSLGGITAAATSKATSVTAMATKIIEDAAAQATQYVDTAVTNDALKAKLKSIITDVLMAKANAYRDKIEQAIKDAREGKPVTSAVSDIQTKIISSIEDATASMKSQAMEAISGSLNETKNAIKAKFNEGIEKTADEVVEMTNSWFDKNLGGTVGSNAGKGTTEGDSAISQLLSFSYSDYLKAFMFIGLTTDDKSIVLRIGDLIQVNLQKEGGLAGNASFKMSNAYTYVELQATVRLKTMFLAMPLITKRTGKDATPYYCLRYHGAMGY